MATAWSEIETVRKENRRELCLRGQEVKKRIEKNGLDDELYTLVGLNFLEIADTPLTSIADGLGKLSNLTSLLLPNNRLETLPKSVGELVKLKTLNLSNNQITQVPEEVAQLPELETLNLSINQLSEFPSVKNLSRLHFLDLSHNKLESLPEDLTDSSLSHLSQIRASENCISEIPGDFSRLPHLNLLDLSENSITDVPADLSQCFKLKELNLKGNKVKDRRLKKLIDQCPTKSILDYLNGVLEKEKKDGGDGKGKGKKERKKKGKQKEEAEEVEDLRNLLQVLRFSEDETKVVKVQPSVLDVRPYIVCCIFRNINFSQSVNMFKHFITLQVKMD